MTADALAALEATPDLPGRGLPVWEGACRQEWVDYNGHMNETFYLLVMSWGTDRFMELVGCDEGYRRRGAGTLYTLETHLRYFREVSLGAGLLVTAQLVEYDAKRLRLYSRVWAEGQAGPAAAAEFLLLHVAGTPPRGAPFAAPMPACLARLAERQRALPRPEDAGRGIALARR